jgi:hypothetical protein
MKKIIALILWCGIFIFGMGISSNALKNTNASHSLPCPCYQGTYAQMFAVTNMWAGDCYLVVGDPTPANNAQEYVYQSSVPPPTPAFGSGNWASMCVQAVPTFTPSPTFTASFTRTYTPSKTPTATQTPTKTPTYTATCDVSATPMCGNQ